MQACDGASERLALLRRAEASGVAIIGRASLARKHLLTTRMGAARAHVHALALGRRTTRNLGARAFLPSTPSAHPA